MSVHGFRSIEEKRALVYDYIRVPHGAKGRFLVEHEITHASMRRWRAMVFADTLEYGLEPRPGRGGVVSVEEKGAVKRLLAENQALREELERQRRSVDALGKAIELLHPSGASRNSKPDAPAQETQLGRSGR